MSIDTGIGLDILVAFSVLAFAYFIVVNAIFIVFTAVAWRQVTHYRRARDYLGAEEAFSSPLTPPISLLLPAYNEEAGIVESVRSLLALRYPELEVIVVNDGSRDGTLVRLVEAFELVPTRRASRSTLPTAPLRATYASRRHPQLWVLDKENGGKADALNAGVNTARYPYFCVVDADALLEEDALLRVAKPLLDDPDVVVATGGIVRIANGCRIEHGRVVEVALPRSRIAALQVVEYFRAFLVGRIGWSRLGSLLIISGAFGLFRRNLVAVAGGYSTTTVGEDMELVVRLHRFLRERGERYRVEFIPDPVAWTEAPEDLSTLGRQRRRWQRGLIETLWTHKGVAFNPRYGRLGLIAFPYFVVFELAGPLIELLGYPAVVATALTGGLSAGFYVGFFVVAVLVGVLLSVSALTLEEFSFRRYTRGREVAWLLGAAFAENVGYRQLNTLWRALALADLARRKRSWGEMQRRGLGYSPARSSSRGR
jgi:cellulose synthase/poly-beta-1,6-N-acetylglucosamine synthase-like glycosyltransferase